MSGRVPAGLSCFHPAVFVGTGCGLGYLPLAPGTFGSLAALPIAWVLLGAANWIAVLTVAALLFALGCWASSVYIRALGREDPGEIVIDEIAAQLAVLAVAPRDVLYFAAGFVLFRLADILKPWPASWADRSIKGGVGAMIDDVFAAAYAAAGLAVLLWALEA